MYEVILINEWTGEKRRQMGPFETRAHANQYNAALRKQLATMEASEVIRVDK